MNIVTSIGVLAAFALLVPALIIFTGRLFKNRSLFILAVYFLSVGLYNLLALDMVPVSEGFKKTAGIINNYLDVPLILLSLLFFCNTSRQKTLIRFTLALFIVYQIIVTAICGFSVAALVYILGPGVLLLFGYALYFFVRYARIAIEKNKQLGKTFMLGSIAFAYGCYGMIYFFHYIQKDPAQTDVLLIYYVACIITAIIMSIGLIWLTQRSKKIKEVQVTRRELAVFFNR